VRAVWVNSWQRKGEKFVLLYIPNARHAWDASDAVDATAHTATAQYFENGFAGSVEAGKKIMSGGAARIRAAPADLLEREGPLLVGAPRVQLPRAGTYLSLLLGGRSGALRPRHRF
jgi:hypothetical protein